MRPFVRYLGLLLIAFLMAGCTGVRALHSTTATSPDWGAVERIFGRKGAVEGDVFKVTFPRADLAVTIGEVKIDPGLALTSWIALKPGSNHAMLMGDLVLLEQEVDPVASRLTQSGMQITALHNHLLGESPHVLFLHIAGRGEPADLARAVKSALALTSTPPTPPTPAPAPSVDWTPVERILGRTGPAPGGVLHLAIARRETIQEDGMEIPPAMGVAHVINFQMVGTKAATTGDFVLIAPEVNPVIRALRAHGIRVTAVHNHMLTETPRLFFLHFWGFDDPERLAQGLLVALDQTNSQHK